MSSTKSEDENDDNSETSTSETNGTSRKTRKTTHSNENGTFKASSKKPMQNDVKNVALKKAQIKRFNCTKCEYRTDDCTEIENHYLLLHREKFIFCKVFGCVKNYSTSNGLRMHCKTIHGSILTCQICNVTSLSPDMKKQHDASHNTSKISCSGCHKPFTRANDHAKHWRYVCVKNTNRVIKCKHCLANCEGDEKLAEVEGCEPGLINHLVGVHRLEGEYLCAFCHRLFKTDKAFQKHQRNCTKTKPEAPIKYWKD